MRKLLPILFLFFSQLTLFAQVPPDADLCHWVNAGPDQNTCGGQAVTLTATFADMKQTNTYAVGNIPYNPFNFNTGTNILVDIDDIWSSVINMGFNFCYWGNNYNQLVIGSNGVVSFNLPYANGYCTWPINNPWPNAAQAMNNAIGCPWHDIDPSVGFNPNRIKIHVDGTAPCRRFIVTFYQIPMFSGACNSQLSSQQIILHESSNVIDHHILNKPICASWNSGRAIQGIQNAAGNQAVVVPGRNSPTQWAAANDGKRFYPTGAPTYTIQWLQGATVIGNTASISVTPNATTTYTVRVTYTNCNGTQTIVTDNVTVNASPINPPPLVPQDICAGQPANLNAGPGFVNYQWSNGSNGQSISVSPAATTTYIVTVTDGAGCTASSSVVVTVGNNIVAPTIPPATICQSASIPLNAGAGFSDYQWSTGQSGQTITVNPAATTTYTVTVTNALGCSGVSNVTITVNQVPPPAPAPINVCAGQSGLLDAGGGYAGYAWSTGSATQTTTVNPAVPTTYTVTVTSIDGCTASGSALVNISTISPPALVAPPILCSGSSTTINAGPGYASYVWSNGVNGQTNTVSPNTGTTYTLTVTDAFGCSAVASVAVNVATPPTPSISGSLSFCAGGNTTLSAPPGFNSYTWSNGFNTQSITVTGAGTYSVTVTDANFCTGTAQATVTVSATLSPVISGNLAPCSGGNTTLDVGAGFASYLWNPGGATTQTINVPAGIYTVSVTSANGCAGTAQVTVTNSPDPTPSITPPPTICTGVSALLTANPAGMAQYQWSNGALGQSQSVSAAGTYTVTVTDANGCTASTSTTVVLNDISLAPLSAATTCFGGTVSLTAPAGYNTYAWSNGDNGPNISVSPASTTTYTLTVTDAQGCTAATTATVNITPPPVATTDGNVNACVGDVVFLGAAGGVDFLWSTGESGFVIAVSPVATTTYTVTVTDAGGCTATAQSTVFVSPLPVPVVTATPPAFCLGGTSILTATGGSNYAWSTGGGNVSSVVVSPTTTTTYTVTVTSAANCSITSNVTVTVNSLPSVNISAPSAICSGQIATLQATGGVTYLWDNGMTTPNINVNPTFTTTYSVTATDANGCTGSQIFTLGVNGIPQAIATSNGPVCTSQFIQLLGDVNVPGGIPPGSTVVYNWTGPGGFTSSDQIPFIQAQTALPGTYTLVVTVNGCDSAPASTDVALLTAPIATASNNGPACGGNIQLFATSDQPGATYQWFGPGITGATVSQQNPILTGMNAQSGEYTVLVTVGSCPSLPASTDVIVTPPPVVNIPPVSFCQGDVANLNATAGFEAYDWASGENTQSITIVASGAYSVTVTDLAGCTASATINITANPLPTPAIAGNTTICNGVATTLTASGGNSYQWSNGTNAASINVTPLTTTTYTVTVTNANNCTAETSTTVTVNPLPVPAVTGPGNICIGSSATLTASGGTSYQWSGGLGTNGTVTVTPVSTTTYTVTVTNAQGCTATTTYQLIVNNSLSPNIPGPNNLCSGLSMTLSASGGAFTTYLWSDGTTGSTITVSPTANTTYSVTVSDANGCTGTTTKTITVFPQQFVSITPTIACGGTGVLSATTGFFSYLWTGNQNSPNLNVSAAGTYFVTVTDANGCTATNSYTFVPIPNPTLAVLTTTNPTCGNANGSINVSGGGGTGTLSYSWSQNAGLNSPTANSLTAGTYTVTVSDTNNCTAVQTATLNNIPGPAINTMTPTNATCGNANGNISVTASGGTGALTYSWSHNAVLNNPNATGLTTGSYTVTVTDTNNCTTSQTVNIANLAGPTLVISNIFDAACGLSNGEATVQVSGGTAPITYSWSQSPGLNNPTATNLPAGSYTVTATDANGCQAIQPIGVANDGAPAVTVNSSTDPTCGNANGNITVSASGGTGALTFTWSHDAFLTTGNATNLTAGNYFVTVTDANNCIDVEAITITNIPGPTIQVTGITPANCGLATGSISTTPTGGTAPLSYSWSQNAGLNSPNATGLAPGTYTVTVTDSNNCFATISATVVATATPTLLVTAENPASCGQANGSATVNASGGVSPYTYSWSQNPALNANAASNLATGPYDVTVTDDNGCTAMVTVNVPTLNAATLNLVGTTNSTCGLNNGTATISATGGNGTITYAWSHDIGLNNTNATALPPGNYTVSATDATGCLTTLDLAVSADQVPSVSVTGVNPTTCGNDNGSILVSASGGVGTISYSWSHNGALNNPNPTNLPSGTYTVTVTDGNGCVATISADVATSPVPTASITPTATTCGTDNGSASASSIGITGPAYSWSNGLNTQNLTNLAAGVYTVTITGTDGCTATASATVDTSPLPTASAAPTATTCGLNNGSITASSTDITAPTYSWSNGLTTQTLTNIAAGTYTVTVTGSGCSATASATIAASAVPTATVTPTATTCGSNNGSLSVTSTGITAPSYSWTPAIPGNPQNPTGLAAGTYTVTVTGTDGCTATQTASIGISSAPVLSVGTINAASCGQVDGSASVTVAGGNAPYTYSWSQNPGLNNPNATSLGVGSYTVTVTDTNGCTDNLSLNVTSLNGPQISLVSTAPALCGQNTGSITFSSSGGTGGLSYIWSHDASLNSLTATGLAGGTYTITVTDANNCDNVLSATVESFDSPVASLASTGSACGLTDGTATLTVSNGTAPFSYVWSHSALLNSPNATGLAPGTYSVTITDTNGCSDTASVIVPGNMPPPAPLCGAITNSSLEFVWTDIPGATGYEITVDGVTDTLSAGTTTYTASGLAQNATVTITVTALGPLECGNSITVSQSCTTISCPALTPTISGLSATYCIDASAVTLTGTPSGGTFSGTGISGNTFDPALAGVGTFTITYDYDDGGACFYTTTLPVTVAALPVAAFTAPDVICLGDQANFQFTGTAVAGTTYNWDFGTAGTQTGAGPHNVTWNSPGNYTASLNITTPEGCTAQFSQPIGVSNVNVTATTGTGYINPGESAQLNAIANSALNGSLTYSWDLTGGDISCTDCSDPLVTPIDDSTTYTVVATDEFGCLASASVNIGLLYQKSVLIPNAFSPNGDGENDIFRLAGFNIQTVDLYIYDRWGGQKFQMIGETLDKGWDGTFKGKDAELGVYVYYAEVTFTDGSEEFFKGNVTLIK